ncbi:diacylglycerol kinase [Amylibacter marinus]|uniref:Diacylglycerol kinase n=1 Tax=Amylibacter marinus TaxID=1475483 RepID=A0ABQ5VRK4_9RHOB|nr:diacylglycerol kinase [Amylibacter marinus]GLQ33801.1 diacylglycerol kinase [Amylibacter marinus]
MGYITREFRRVGTRLINTYDGIAITLKDEASFAQWIGVNIASWVLMCFVEMTSIERIVIIVLGLMILVMELLNTGIEAAIDRIGPEIHPLSKKAKDAGCAAVAIMALAGLVSWAIILLD